MFPEPKTEKPASTALSIFIAVLALLLITGAISWVYFNSKSATPEPVATTAPTNTLSPITEAKTEILAALDDIDNDLSEIEADEGSEDDTVNF
ncbi:MAG: hypothetical protein NUV80_02080 [Candidatus Berkelbacteria bacterium]|nr:hypothetical protein [Candidatus Berkelbacteria bacterium]MCR4307323.1 hypothetical protein [Candidatus Berkelbacteria bacterium]